MSRLRLVSSTPSPKVRCVGSGLPRHAHTPEAVHDPLTGHTLILASPSNPPIRPSKYQVFIRLLHFTKLTLPSTSNYEIHFSSPLCRHALCPPAHLSIHLHNPQSPIPTTIYPPINLLFHRLSIHLSI
ncbi:unnamed protein product [Protopolystoma xenopodis]|uniref:Uncharacterized protein n=1 Tax=Protopolystoma xenopodis TaxID=117903 RepID=A0A3S5BAS3_9PLAT|nr:unnamed protein product [Protopolystoma xenopodis]